MDGTAGAGEEDDDEEDDDDEDEQAEEAQVRFGSKAASRADRSSGEIQLAGNELPSIGGRAW